MIYVIIGMSLLFIAIGFIVTENNSKYLLSGYNTMSDEEKEQVDIKAYIPFFRKFHVFLGISFLVIGCLLTYFISENAAGIFLGIYPILAYIYLIWKGAKFSKGLSAKSNKIGIYILAGTLLFVCGVFLLGFKEDPLVFTSATIEFRGSYGEVVNPSDIKTIELVNLLPKITLKTNGFALGTINKGYFRTSDGDVIKLILNSDNKPYILFTKTDGKKIYFSAKEKSNKEIYFEMKKKLPNILYKQ